MQSEALYTAGLARELTSGEASELKPFFHRKVS